MTGFVSLVGAGPGDPELLTIKGLKRLQEADLILYDALVCAEMLEYAPHARRFCVGKRGGQQSVAQDTIEKLLIKAALRGERVVRLKCGDPYVFGRGGEEGLALAERGISFEVIPGISTSIAAAGAAGIPITHRGIVSSFTVASGHSPDVYESVIGNCEPNTMTLVFLMAIRNSSDIARNLLEKGWSPKTGIALVFGATTSEQVAWKGTVQELVNNPSVIEIPETNSKRAGAGKLPGTLIVGDVVFLANQLSPQTKWLNEESSQNKRQWAQQGR
mgnify:CR=1 FL=1